MKFLITGANGQLGYDIKRELISRGYKDIYSPNREELDITSEEQVLKMLNFYKEELKKAKETYLKKYGPVTICQITDPFKWNDNPFPWEK